MQQDVTYLRAMATSKQRFHLKLGCPNNVPKENTHTHTTSFLRVEKLYMTQCKCMSCPIFTDGVFVMHECGHHGKQFFIKTNYRCKGQ